MTSSELVMVASAGRALFSAISWLSLLAAAQQSSTMTTW